MEVKKIKRKIIIKTYLATFEYKTFKGYRREQQRIFRATENESVYKIFDDWKNEQRTMLNVQILSIIELKSKREEIEI